MKIMLENHKYNEEIFKMISLIVGNERALPFSFTVDGVKFKIYQDIWSNHESYDLSLEYIETGLKCSVSVGKMSDYNIYTNGCFVHYTSDGFYNLTEYLGYTEGSDDKVLFDYLKKYCRNINIEKLLNEAH